MVWFKVDDGFHAHPKAVAAGNAACGLWARCGSYSSHYSTDGFIPNDTAKLYGSRAEIAKLVAAGLWTVEDGGYRMHDFHEYNPTAEEVAEDRARNAERQKRWRGGRRRNTVTEAVSNGERNALLTPPQRNGVSNGAPTRPVPSYLHPPTTSTVMGDPAGTEDDQRSEGRNGADGWLRAIGGER